MRRILVLLFLMLCFCVVITAQKSDVIEGYSSQYWSYVDGKKYNFKVTKELLEKTPSWKENDENPPLSVKKAISAATEQLSKFIKIENWDFQKATLEKTNVTGKWLYLIEFSEDQMKANPPKKSGIYEYIGGVKTFRIVVLMDGSTIEPKIEDMKTSKTSQK